MHAVQQNFGLCLLPIPKSIILHIFGVSSEFFCGESKFKTMSTFDFGNGMLNKRSIASINRRMTILLIKQNYMPFVSRKSLPLTFKIILMTPFVDTQK